MGPSCQDSARRPPLGGEDLHGRKIERTGLGVWRTPTRDRLMAAIHTGPRTFGVKPGCVSSLKGLGALWRGLERPEEAAASDLMRGRAGENVGKSVAAVRFLGHAAFGLNFSCVRRRHRCGRGRPVRNIAAKGRRSGAPRADVWRTRTNTPHYWHGGPCVDWSMEPPARPAGERMESARTRFVRTGWPYRLLVGRGQCASASTGRAATFATGRSPEAPGGV